LLSPTISTEQLQKTFDDTVQKLRTELEQALGRVESGSEEAKKDIRNFIAREAKEDERIKDAEGWKAIADAVKDDL